MRLVTQTVASIVGKSQVTDWDTSIDPLKLLARSATTAEKLPACIAYPETSEQLAEVIKCAFQNQWTVLPCGRGSKLNWGALLQGVDLVVSTQRLNRVIEHAVGDLTVTVESGVAFAELQAALLKTRQFLAIDPAYPQEATLGGIVATRDTGALRQRYDGIRDMLIGVSFVRHDGQIAKAGGRVVKNVAGYDLMKLMTGSFGTLGVLSQLTFRTYPLQATSRTVLLTGAAEAIQALTADVQRSPLTPVAMDVLSPNLLPIQETNHYGLALRFQSIEAGVVEQIALLRTIAADRSVACEEFSDDADPQFWQRLTETLFPKTRETAVAIAKFGVPPDTAVPLLADVESMLAPGSWQGRVHASSGIGTIRLESDPNSPDRIARVRSRCQSVGGYLTLLEAPTDWKRSLDAWALSPAVERLMNRLRDQFDPDRRLSPGRFS